MRPTRKLLRLLCLLTFSGGAALLGLGIHVSVTVHLHASAAALAGLGGMIVLMAVLGFAGAGRDKSNALMIFFFFNLFLVTCLFVASYAAFCFKDTVASWVKHHWSSSVLAYLRTQSCCGTYESAVDYLEGNFMALGAIGFAVIVVSLLSLHCVVRIVTLPIVMKSMLTVINIIFMALGSSIFAYGCAVKSHDNLTAGQQWIAIVFIASGTFLVALSVLGVLGSRAKSRTLLLIYIVGIGSCLLALLVCAVGAFTRSDSLATSYSLLTDSSLACDIDLQGCTNCTEALSCDGVTKDADGYWISCATTTSSSSTNCTEGMTVLNAAADQDYEANDIAECGKCPEWSESDVQAYLRGNLHLLGLCAVIVCFFIIVGFASALILRRSLAGYQTDSI